MSARTTLPCEADPEKQYPDDRSLGEIAEAKRVCAGCPLATRDACLERAIDLGDTHGVWGGLTYAERRLIAAGRAYAGSCRTCRLPMAVSSKTACTECRRKVSTRPSDHGPRIATMRSSGMTWIAISAAIGCTPKAARNHYERQQQRRELVAS